MIDVAQRRGEGGVAEVGPTGRRVEMDQRTGVCEPSDVQHVGALRHHRIAGRRVVRVRDVVRRKRPVHAGPIREPRREPQDRLADAAPPDHDVHRSGDRRPVAQRSERRNVRSPTAASSRGETRTRRHAPAPGRQAALRCRRLSGLASQPERAERIGRDRLLETAAVEDLHELDGSADRSRFGPTRRCPRHGKTEERQAENPNGPSTAPYGLPPVRGPGEARLSHGPA